MTLDKVYHAAYVLKDAARKTDLIAAPDLCAGGNVWLKSENLQVTGSFKLRGAYYKMSQLSEDEKAKGVIACSAGNHAQGVALAAAKNGIPALICIPDSAPISKIEATRSYGAEVELVKGSYDDAYARALELQAEQGRTFIHPFDDEDVIAGQGTIGLEILDQMPDVEAIVVPVGGGGLISGVAFAVKSLRPQVKVYGVQAAGAASMLRSIQKGKILTLDAVSTFADGIAVKQPGENTFALVRRYVDGIVDVSEDEVASAILALIERQKMISEGAGAVAVAAAMYGKIDLEGRKTVCLLSGGNIDVNILSRVITRGLVNSGRNANLTIALIDKPGQLEGVSRIVSEHGGNVVSVQYDRSDPSMAINSCFLTLGLETRDHAQLQEIRAALNGAGFEIVEGPTVNGSCRV
ncbi:threonine ammonia-lyase [Ruminococcaceae bacterium OttesenSCG-928-O06]|nr:threonine ammonia-lyase [Ruminococcaceae bacterium OttesenSCG-928-O06]